MPLLEPAYFPDFVNAPPQGAHFNDVTQRFSIRAIQWHKK